MVDSALEIMALASDLHEHFVQMLPPLRASSHRFQPTLLYLLREVNPEPIGSVAGGFMANVDATFVDEVFDIAKRGRKPDIHHHLGLDDFGRSFEISERILGHFRG